MKIALVSIALYSCIIIGMQHQEQQLVSVTASDGEKCMVPLWQVIESNTLHKLLLAAQEEKNTKKREGDLDSNKTLAITISFVHSQELKKYENTLALGLSPTLGLSPFFKKYFDSHNTEQRDWLINIAEKLNATFLTTQLLSCIEEDILKTHINPHIDLKPFIAALSNRIIKRNVHNKNIQIEKTIENDRSIEYDNNGSCRYIPSSQLNNCYYNSITYPHFDVDKDTHYVIEQFQKRSDEKSNSVSYFITPNIPSSSPQDPDPCKKFLWLKSETTSRVITLEHPHPIDACRFSPNGAFLAITSHNRESLESCLSVTSLGTTLNQADFVDLFRKKEIGLNITLFFNFASTLLAAATTQGVYLFDLQGNIVKHLTDEKYYEACDITWNNDSTTLCVLARSDTTQSYSTKIIIYNIQDYSIKKIIPIVYGYSYELFIFHNIIVIPINTIPIATLKPDTSLLSGPIESLQHTFNYTLYDQACNGMLLVDATTGNVISFCQNPAEDLANVYCIIDPYYTFMLTAELSSKDSTRVKLYDIATRKSRIILDNLPYMSGIGFTPNGRSIIVTRGTENTFVHLYDEKTASALKWLQEEPSLMQRYALYRLHKAQEDELELESAAYHVLKSLPEQVQMCINNIYSPKNNNK